VGRGRQSSVAAARSRAESPKQGTLVVERRLGLHHGVLLPRNPAGARRLHLAAVRRARFNLYTAEEELGGPGQSFSLFAGSWNSIQSEKTLSEGGGPDNWYESDFYAGLKANFFGNTEAKAFYIAYSYPNGAFNTVQEIDMQFQPQRRRVAREVGAQPLRAVRRRVRQTALGTDKGAYAEIGSVRASRSSRATPIPVSLALPMKVGLSISDYYEDANGDDDTFGFFQGGPVVSDSRWRSSRRVRLLGRERRRRALYAFGNNLKQYNEGDTPWVVGTTSITFSY
jgi:hypothetical protein